MKASKSRIKSVLFSPEFRALLLGILSEPGSKWDGGPNGVSIAVMCDEESSPTVIPIFFDGDRDSTWPDFEAMAEEKARVALEAYLPSELCPRSDLIWNESANGNYAGGVTEDGWSVGVSGATAACDKRIAELTGACLSEAGAFIFILPAPAYD